ncbi:MAG: hypothetical protein HY514_02395 [Candidatus Aenigmarchaeota archaeon]|nr:hypothetical protein [Candidatus Aenigmarchaeota archaeon]
MPTETQTIVAFPGFTYRGFDVPALEMPASLIENLGTTELPPARSRRDPVVDHATVQCLC